ncbi:MAG: hypothetical protein KDG89_12475 [Geminicoccaceae bacterium]|nr:hypothetical protein [Geminicoccaceae bacterium]
MPFVAVLLAVLLATPALAAGPEDEVAPLQETTGAGLFTVGNTLFAVLHELAHGLIAELDLPILGNEETAADSIAALLMIPSEPNPFRRRLILAATRGWATSADIADDADAQKSGASEFWDIHVRDIDRYRATLCLLVGSDTRAGRALAARIGMNESDVDLCRTAYANADEAFERLTAPFRRRKGAGGGRIEVVYDDDPAFQAERGLMRRAGSVRRAIADLTARIALPNDLTVHFTACDGGINAWWDPDTRTVEVCYELVAYYEDLAPFDETAGGEE